MIFLSSSGSSGKFSSGLYSFIKKMERLMYDVRWKREDGRGKMEEGRGKREDGRGKMLDG